MAYAVALVVAYLLGSMPSAYIAGRLKRGIDLRQHGSGNLGTTNVYRVLGSKAAIVVFAADVAKGALPVWLLPRLLPPSHRSLWALALGLAAIAGHVRSAFLGWRGGGKGVATAAGVFVALAPVAALLAVAGWIVTVVCTGYASLASLVAAVLLPVGLALTRGASSPVFGAGLVVSLLVIWMHRANIGRLRRGEEHRFGRPRPDVR